MSAMIWYIVFYGMVGMAAILLYRALRNLLCVTKRLGCG